MRVFIFDTEFRRIPWFNKYYISKSWIIIRNWRKLKPQENRYWYLYVNLYNNWIIKKKVIHRLVMLTFKWDSKLQVNHIDWNKKNNNLNNLEYCTAKENTRHADESWLRNIKWTNHYFHKKVCQYKWNNLIKVFDYMQQAEDELWISHSNISNCCRWKRKTAWWFNWKYYD